MFIALKKNSIVVNYHKREAIVIFFSQKSINLTQITTQMIK